MDIENYLITKSPIAFELEFFFNPDSKMVILDVGACEGEDSIRYKKMFSKAQVFSFEPLPANIIKIENNKTQYNLSGITIVPFALSDSTGDAIFFVSSGAPLGKENTDKWNYGNKSSSLLSPTKNLKANFPWLEFKDSITIRTQRLDSFCNASQISKIDFIHMDVQGAELKVLNGAGEWLKKTKAIWMEVENIELYQSQPLKSEIEQFMKRNGFLKLLDTVTSISGDQFYINKKNLSFLSLSTYRLLKNIHRLKDKIGMKK